MPNDREPPTSDVGPARRSEDGPRFEVVTERPFQKLRRLEQEGNLARWDFFGRLRASTRSETVTTVLLAANCAVFAAMVSWGVGVFDPTPDELLRWGALSPLLIRDGSPWRLLTACFLHVGLIHLAVNMFSLWSLRFVEHWFGHFSFAVLYVASGLFGSLASTAFGDPLVVGAGASGAIFGVFGAVLGAALRWKRLGVDSRVTGPILKGVFQTIVLNAVIAASLRNLDHFAHAGGFASGIVLGYVLAHAPTPAGVAGRRRRGYTVALLACVVIAALVLALRRPGLAAAAERVDAMSATDAEAGLGWPPPRIGPPDEKLTVEERKAAYLERLKTEIIPALRAREAELHRLRAEYPELKRAIDAELLRYRLMGMRLRIIAPVRRPDSDPPVAPK